MSTQTDTPPTAAPETPAASPLTPDLVLLARLTAVGDRMVTALEAQLTAIATLPDLKAAKALQAMALAYDRTTRAVTRVAAQTAKLNAPRKSTPAKGAAVTSEAVVAATATEATAAGEATATGEATAAANARATITRNRQSVARMIGHAIGDLPDPSTHRGLCEASARALGSLDDAAFEQAKLGMLTLRLCGLLGIATNWPQRRDLDWVRELMVIEAALARGETWAGIDDGIDPPWLMERATALAAAVARERGAPCVSPSPQAQAVPA